MTEDTIIGSLPDFHPEPLHPDLAKCIYPSETWGRVLHHPLYIDSPYHEQMNSRYNRTYGEKSKYLKESKAKHDWFGVLGIHERPYRMQAFREIEPLISDDAYWGVVSYLWMDTENVWQQRAEWRKLWRSRRPNREAVMSPDEQAALAALPDPITIYRGSYIFPQGLRGFAWTIDRERAIWFANRWRPTGIDPYLVTAQLPKRHVIAYFADRNESEIVTFPERAQNADVEKLPPGRHTEKMLAAMMQHSHTMPRKGAFE